MCLQSQANPQSVHTPFQFGCNRPAFLRSLPRILPTELILCTRIRHPRNTHVFYSLSAFAFFQKL